MHKPHYIDYGFNDGDYVVLDPDKEPKINSSVLVHKKGHPTTLFSKLILKSRREDV